MIAYTAIIGNHDTIKEQPLTGAPFAVIRSVPFEGSNSYKARWAKLMAHKIFPGAEYVLWIDGSMQLNPCDMRELIREHLSEHDIAVMKHPTIDCIYDDSLACMSHGKATPEQVTAIHRYYEDIGFPRRNGHVENGMILRRMTPKVIAFCELWFQTLVGTGVTRDQWYMAPLARDRGVTYKVIPERFFKVFRHNTTTDDIRKLDKRYRYAR